MSSSVGRDHKITYPDEEPTSCETQTASICSTDVIITTTTLGSFTSTITSTSSECQEWEACLATDVDVTITSTPDNCPLPTEISKRHDNTARDGDPDDRGKSDAELEPRQNGDPIPGCAANAVVYPSDPDNVGDIREILSDYDYQEAKSSEFGFTSFFWVPYLDRETMARLKDSVSTQAPMSSFLSRVLTLVVFC